MPKKKKDSVDPFFDAFGKIFDAWAYVQSARSRGERDAKAGRPPSLFIMDPNYRHIYMNAYNATKRAQQQNLRQSRNLTTYTYDHNHNEMGCLNILFYGIVGTIVFIVFFFILGIISYIIGIWLGVPPFGVFIIIYFIVVTPLSHSR